MPSSYTTRSRLTKQATGENTNTWGIILNVVLDLIDAAMDGTVEITGDTTLSTANGATDQGRKRFLYVSSATACTVTIPSLEKLYFVYAENAAVIISNGSDSVTIPAGDAAWVATDGTDIFKSVQTDFGGARLKNLADPVSNQDAATKAYVVAMAFATQAGDYPGMSGNQRRALIVNDAGDAPEWGGRTLLDWERKTTTYQAVVGDRLLCDTSGGAFTVTLPATPTDGDEVWFADGGYLSTTGGWGTNNLTLDRNGSTIMSLSEDLICDVRGGSFGLTYKNSTWRVTT